MLPYSVPDKLSITPICNNGSKSKSYSILDVVHIKPKKILKELGGSQEWVSKNQGRLDCMFKQGWSTHQSWTNFYARYHCHGFYRSRSSYQENMVKHILDRCLQMVTKQIQNITVLLKVTLVSHLRWKIRTQSFPLQKKNHTWDQLLFLEPLLHFLQAFNILVVLTDAINTPAQTFAHYYQTTINQVGD